MLDELADATAVVTRSRWVIDRAKFTALLSSRGVAQNQIAIRMGYGRGVNADHAAQYLWTVVHKGLPTKGAHILAAASLLDSDPYSFATPVEAQNFDKLHLAVRIVREDPRKLSLVQAGAMQIQLLLEDAGYGPSNDDEELVRDVARIIAGRTAGEPRARGPEARVLEQAPNITRELKKLEILSRYVATIRHERKDKSARKDAIDVTGLQTGFESWKRPEYAAVLDADHLFACSAMRRRESGFPRLRRTFAVSTRSLFGDTIERLDQTIRSQINRGIEVAVKYFKSPSVEPRYVGDMALVGDWAVDAGSLEALDENTIEAPLQDIFVHRKDHIRFSKMLKRLDWVNDRKNTDVSVRSIGDLESMISDLRGSVGIL
ncbi:MAG: hypothetical protein KGJ79_16620 [Alphaproteobacteria bacterium]|nr:hypothetical protein [Alphaproteobacteria bacterium]MDE2492405.1 hypothetical protein [Alphaproteobacteria bacterium]